MQNKELSTINSKLSIAIIELEQKISVIKKAECERMQEV